MNKILKLSLFSVIVGFCFVGFYFLGYNQSPTRWQKGYKKGYNDALYDVIIFREEEKLNKAKEELEKKNKEKQKNDKKTFVYPKNVV